MCDQLRAAELKRDGTTIHSDVEISYVDAILGVTTPVRTVDGQVGRKLRPGNLESTAVGVLRMYVMLS